jgi:glutamine synthetase
MNKTIVVCEYLWIGGEGELRSKTRIFKTGEVCLEGTLVVPNWNYDGSSTKQAPSDGNTEVILKPHSIFPDPFRKGEKSECYIVLCDTYEPNGKPLPTNYRYNAEKIFNSAVDEIPLFGLEQEYFILLNSTDKANRINAPDARHYCGQSSRIERAIVEKHLHACLYAGLTISGINAEVSEDQWEFQIGPCTGIRAADQLVVARYLLERVSELYNAGINYYPKPHSLINGSGCHINFSTASMRAPGGLKVIESCMPKLEKRHKEHIAVYGEHNELRLTGKHETSDMNKFTFGVGTRNTSVRIPTQTAKDGFGYFEDRRPASNIDPYKATSIVFKTCCLSD